MQRRYPQYAFHLKQTPGLKDRSMPAFLTTLGFWDFLAPATQAADPAMPLAPDGIQALKTEWSPK